MDDGRILALGAVALLGAAGLVRRRGSRHVIETGPWDDDSRATFTSWERPDMVGFSCEVNGETSHVYLVNVTDPENPRILAMRGPHVDHPGNQVVDVFTPSAPLHGPHAQPRHVEPWTDGYSVGFMEKMGPFAPRYVYLTPSSSGASPDVFVYEGEYGRIDRDEAYFFVGFPTGHGGRKSIRRLVPRRRGSSAMDAYLYGTIAPALHRRTIGGWTAHWEYPGFLEWTNPDVPHVSVNATPGWEGATTTIPVEICLYDENRNYLDSYTDDDLDVEAAFRRSIRELGQRQIPPEDRIEIMVRKYLAALAPLLQRIEAGTYDRVFEQHLRPMRRLRD